MSKLRDEAILNNIGPLSDQTNTEFASRHCKRCCNNGVGTF